MSARWFERRKLGRTYIYVELTSEATTNCIRRTTGSCKGDQIRSAGCYIILGEILAERALPTFPCVRPYVSYAPIIYLHTYAQYSRHICFLKGVGLPFVANFAGGSHHKTRDEFALSIAHRVGFNPETSPISLPKKAPLRRRN